MDRHISIWGWPGSLREAITNLVLNAVDALPRGGTIRLAARPVGDMVEVSVSDTGVGIPPETPTCGNIIAEGRALFRILPHPLLYPGIFLALTVLAVNMLGDGLRDTLDPRMKLRRG